MANIRGRPGDWSQEANREAEVPQLVAHSAVVLQNWLKESATPERWRLAARGSIELS